MLLDNCPWQDSNLHVFRQRILNPHCLPFQHKGIIIGFFVFSLTTLLFRCVLVPPVTSSIVLSASRALGFDVVLMLQSTKIVYSRFSRYVYIITHPKTHVNTFSEKFCRKFKNIFWPRRSRSKSIFPSTSINIPKNG